MKPAFPRLFAAYAAITALLVLASSSLANENDNSGSDSSAYTDVVLLTNGASVTGKIVVDEPNHDLVIERRGDLMRIEIPRKKIFRITDSDGYEVALAEYNALPKKKPLFRDPQVWTYLGGAYDNDVFRFSVDVAGLYRVGERTRLGLGVGYVDEFRSMLKLSISASEWLFDKPYVSFLWVETGYVLRFLGDEFDYARDGGFSAGGGIGVRIPSHSAPYWIARLGYVYETKGEEAHGGDRLRRESLLLQVGVAF